MSRDPSAAALDHQAGIHRIFVVQLRLDANPARGRMAGRIRHTYTNDAAHFESAAELMAFIEAHLDVVPGVISCPSAESSP